MTYLFSPAIHAVDNRKVEKDGCCPPDLLFLAVDWTLCTVSSGHVGDRKDGSLGGDAVLLMIDTSALLFGVLDFYVPRVFASPVPFPLPRVVFPRPLRAFLSLSLLMSLHTLHPCAAGDHHVCCVRLRIDHSIHHDLDAHHGFDEPKRRSRSQIGMKRLTCVQMHYGSDVEGKRRWGRRATFEGAAFAESAQIVDMNHRLMVRDYTRLRFTEICSPTGTRTRRRACGPKGVGAGSAAGCGSRGLEAGSVSGVLCDSGRRSTGMGATGGSSERSTFHFYLRGSQGWGLLRQYICST